MMLIICNHPPRHVIGQVFDGLEYFHNSNIVSFFLIECPVCKKPECDPTCCWNLVFSIDSNVDNGNLLYLLTLQTDKIGLAVRLNKAYEDDSIYEEVLHILKRNHEYSGSEEIKLSIEKMLMQIDDDGKDVDGKDVDGKDVDGKDVDVPQLQENGNKLHPNHAFHHNFDVVVKLCGLGSSILTKKPLPRLQKRGNKLHPNHAFDHNFDVVVKLCGLGSSILTKKPLPRLQKKREQASSKPCIRPQL